jgi:hypothetical protein
VHRLPVLFRAVLLLPAALVLGLANYGLAVLSLFCWLLALVAGRLPAALHEAIAGVIRFQLRYFGYTFVLTSEYPWTGLLGDGEPIGILRPITVSADTVMSAADSGQATAAPASADPWRLQLSGGARAVVALLLTVGAVAAVAVAITAQLGPNSPVLAFSNARELLRVEGAYNQLASSVTNFESATVACTRLSCLTAQDRLVATALGSFAAEVRSAGIGGPSGSDARRLANDAAGARTSIDRLAGATTVSEYESIYVSLPLRRQLTDLNSDYDKVIHDLG